MKVKDLVEELQNYSPDGTLEVRVRIPVRIHDQDNKPVKTIGSVKVPVREVSYFADESGPAVLLKVDY